MCHAFIFFKDLYTRNPKHINHLDKVNEFKISMDFTSGITNKVFCIDKDGSEHIFSWNDCVDGKGSDNYDRLIDSFRDAIQTQINEFNYKKKCCDLCGNNDKCEVDHKNIDFIDLVKNFIKINVNTPDKFDTNNIGQNCFRKEDNIFKNKWFDYHKENAILQYLCVKCHNFKTYKK